MKGISHIAYDLDRLKVRHFWSNEYPCQGWEKIKPTSADLLAELEDYGGDVDAEREAQLDNSGLDDIFKYSDLGFDDKAAAIKCVLTF